MTSPINGIMLTARVPPRSLFLNLSGLGQSVIVPTTDCPPWVFDPVKDTERRLELIGQQGVQPIVVMTYFAQG